MAHPVYTPNRSIVRALRRVDRGFSVAWLEPPGRWGVFHDLQRPDDPLGCVYRLAGELSRDLRTAGYTVTFEECLRTAHQKVFTANLVFLVQEPDGGYRPLDDRAIEKAARMAWLRRNWELNDWLRDAKDQADDERMRRQRSKEDVWDVIARDRVFREHAHDLLWGQRPVRSVQGGLEMEGTT